MGYIFYFPSEGRHDLGYFLPHRKNYNGFGWD
jgi:hypothetical protein